MKKIILPLIIILMFFALVACTSSTSQATGENISGDGTPNGGPQFNMPTEVKFVIGTVKLDETDYAVDAEQASQLLPLWKALRSLSEDDTTAQAEIDALITQIGDTMTPEQTNAIEDMNLTMQDMGSVMEILGIEGNFGSPGQISEEMRATMEAARASGDFPGGGPGGDFPGGGPGGGQGPGGGFGGFGGAEMDPEARATAIAERGGMRGSGFGINTTLLDGIIEFLEAKVQ
jgi:hypothetical protein